MQISMRLPLEEVGSSGRTHVLSLLLYQITPSRNTRSSQHYINLPIDSVVPNDSTVCGCRNEEWAKLLLVCVFIKYLYVIHMQIIYSS